MLTINVQFAPLHYQQLSAIAKPYFLYVNAISLVEYPVYGKKMFYSRADAYAYMSCMVDVIL